MNGYINRKIDRYLPGCQSTDIAPDYSNGILNNDRWIDRQMDGQIDGQIDRWIDR